MLFGLSNRHAFRVGVALVLGAVTVPLNAASPAPTYAAGSPEAARAALNRQQADDARRQLAENAASQQAFNDAQAAREAQIASDQAGYEAQKARLAAEYDAAMAQWREDVAACRAGDRARCRHR